MTVSPTLAIQEAMYERAAADAGLEALDTEVFDHVPEKHRPRRYVVIGESFTTPDNDHSGRGWITISTLSIWTDERGFKVAHQIKDRLIELFDHVPLTVDGFHHVETRHEFDQLLRDPEPILRRAILRLRTTTEEL